MSSCIVCKKTGNCRPVFEKGMKGLSEASKQRGDLIHEDISKQLADNLPIGIHEKCRKDYTCKSNIMKVIKQMDTEFHQPPSCSTRQKVSVPYEFRTHCVICAQIADYEKYERMPNQYPKVCRIQMIDATKSSIVQRRLLSTCEERLDKQAIEVKARIEFARDLRAVDAVYHHNCYSAFCSSRNIQYAGASGLNRRNMDLENDEAVNKLCTWLKDKVNQSRQYTLVQLRQQMYVYLPDGVPAYSMQHLKRRLQESMGEEIIFSEIDGKHNVLTFASSATEILHHSYTSQQDARDGRLDETVKVGQKLREDIRTLKNTASDCYPKPYDVQLEELESQVPVYLLNLLRSIINGSLSDISTANRLVIASIAHAIMQATRQRQYVSPLQMSTALFIHQTTRSRVLLDVLSSLGLCSSYSLILGFERSAALSSSIEGLPVGLQKTCNGGGFCQWVADNFDYNEDTLTGHDTTHVMGIIACQTSSSFTSSMPLLSVKKKKATADDIKKAGSFVELIHPYKHPFKGKIAEVIFKDLQPVNISIDKFKYLDSLWLLSSRFQGTTPNWQGFMSKAATGPVTCTNVIYDPMIPLNPTTWEAVYSTMVFVAKQSQSVEQHCSVVTFDQPLYYKAYCIKQENALEFKNMFVRLGGFHQLMSFLGAGCKLMEDSGLEDVWAEVYAPNSIRKMTAGKSYARTLRACLLIDSALHSLLLSSTCEPEQNSEEDEADKSDSVTDEEEDFDTDFFSDDFKAVQVESHKQIDLSDLFSEKVPSLGAEEEVFDSWPDIEMGSTSESADVCTDELLHHLAKVSDDLMSGQCQWNEAVGDSSVQEIHKIFCELKTSKSKSRTAKLWISFMEFVSITRLFITAERTGNWLLHLKSTQDMLPYFAAAGHTNYAKCCRLYLQDAQNLCRCLVEPFENGFFTVRRNASLFWSGTWSDMVIEQCLMRSGKTAGGLVNITHRDTARTVWLLAAHVLAQYSECLRTVTGNFAGTWSTQHRDITAGRMQQDARDMQKFLNFLKSHNPFEGKDDSCLVNISTGVIADDRVNVDRAVELGKSIQRNLTGKSIGQATFKRNEQAVTFAVMKKALVLSAGDKMYVSSAELSQRLIAIASTSQQLDPKLYSFELSTVAPAIFTDDGNMRKSSKSQLAKCILARSTNICLMSEIEASTVVVDGCAVLQQLPWPKVGTILDSCVLYFKYIASHYMIQPCKEVHVIFDSYEISTTKDPEQKRRRLNTSSSADVVLDENTPIPSNKVAFLANKKNKQNFILLLAKFLSERDIQVTHAGDEGDADVVIVQKAVQLARVGETVKVISEDTDILVLLLHHYHAGNSIYMQTKTKIIDIRMAHDVLGDTLCACLPFLHAMSGCDTTSSFFGVGKLKPLKVLENSKELQKEVLIFGCLEATMEAVTKAGEKFLMEMYGAKPSVTSLDELRYLNMLSRKYTPLERLPPTSRSAYYHSLRVHLQTTTWHYLKSKLPKEDYGFMHKNGELTPIITDMDPAPPELLKEIKCSCSKGEQLCVSCNCNKKRLPCTVHCKCGGECENSQTINYLNTSTAQNIN